MLGQGLQSNCQGNLSDLARGYTMNVQLGAENRETALMSRIGQAALVTITLSLMYGCATTRVEQNRQAITGIAADEAMVILGRDNTTTGKPKEFY